MSKFLVGQRVIVDIGDLNLEELRAFGVTFIHDMDCTIGRIGTVHSINYIGKALVRIDAVGNERSRMYMYEDEWLRPAFEQSEKIIDCGSVLL